MIHEEITHEIIGSAIQVHADLGPGLLESAYRVCLHDELMLKGVKVEVEWPIPVTYRGRRIEVGYRVDLVVADTVLIELKAVSKLLPIHEAQLLSYLRLGGFPIGLLINFHEPLLRDGIRRLVNQIPRRGATDSL